MRLWSLHPRYLDTKGLLAVWREGLLALHVLRGQTKGYKNHPQLERFKNHPQPVAAISAYLHSIVDEAETRNFTFKREKLEPLVAVEAIVVTDGQLKYETEHLRKKLVVRDLTRAKKFHTEAQFELHPLFKSIPGPVAAWEKLLLSY